MGKGLLLCLVALGSTASFPLTRNRRAHKRRQGPTTGCMGSSGPSFPFVHESIAAILKCETVVGDDDRLSLGSKFIDPDTLESLWNHEDDASGDENEREQRDLQRLAVACERALFGRQGTPGVIEHEPHDPLLRSLVHLGNHADSPSKRLAAALFALNRLESVLRHSSTYTAGRAPLLKTMLLKIQRHDETLFQILGTLLLPMGLNLRNLVWHGFLSDVPRPWLALCVVLIQHLQTLEQDQDTGKSKSKTYIYRKHNSTTLPLVDLGSYPSFQMLLLEENDAYDDQIYGHVRAWLPPSHRTLLDLAWRWWHIEAKVACATALMVLLLEHGLRLSWCHVNGIDNASAEPHRYYVTMDGHGQRAKHDLLLHPFLGSHDETAISRPTTTGRATQQQLNALVAHHLPGAVTALLTDLFASSSGGPNVRAALAHGLWDDWFERELVDHVRSDEQYLQQEPLLRDTIAVVWQALRGAARRPSYAMRNNYRPVFSYTAVTRRSLALTMELWERLRTMILMEDHSHVSSEAARGIAQVLQLDEVTWRDAAIAVSEVCGNQHDVGPWTIEAVYREYDCNAGLASCGAARSLLNDVVGALSSFTETFEDARSDLLGNSEDGKKLTTRQNRRLQRICGFGEFAFTLYGFAGYVAMLAIHHNLSTHTNTQEAPRFGPGVLLKAVERSRMCVSTLDTYLTANSERALKAAAEYTKGKAVQEVLRYRSLP